MPPKTFLKYSNGIKHKRIVNDLKHRIDVINSVFTDKIPDDDKLGNHIDTRDFKMMAYFIPVKGKTQEEKDTNLKNQYREMVVGFIKHDEKTMKKYLDYMYSGFDSLYDIMNKKVIKEEDLTKLAMCFRSSQTFSVKREENLKYFNSRYPTKEAQACFASQLQALNAISWDFSVINKRHKDFKIQGVLPLKSAQYGNLNIAGDFALGNKSAIEHDSNIINFKVPKEYVNSSRESFDKDGFGPDLMPIYGLNNLTNYLGAEEAKSGMTMTTDTQNYCFIGDKSVKEVALETLSKDLSFSILDDKAKERAIKKQAIHEFEKALVKGDKIISFVTPRRDNGNIVFEEKRIKPNIKDLPPTEEDLNKHSWFRKKFFNWGPFKIKRSKESQRAIDNLYANAQPLNPTVISKAQAAFNKEVKDLVDYNKKVSKVDPVKAQRSMDKKITDATLFIDNEDLSSKLENAFKNENQINLDNKISNEKVKEIDNSDLQIGNKEEDIIKID